MKVEIINQPSLEVVVKAFRKCTNTECDSVEINGDFHLGIKDERMIKRNGIDLGHGSALEHMFFSFEIDDISRALLQELARHRHASMSVKSTRYTLKEILSDFNYTKEEATPYNKKETV